MNDNFKRLGNHLKGRMEDHFNVVGNHLSGLLLIKKMPDSSTRMVFSNEMGLGFFDFEFACHLR